MAIKQRVLGIAAAVIGFAIASSVAVHAATSPKVIKISSKRFEYKPSMVKLKKGVPVVLELVTEDIVMGFNLPDFGVRADIVPGKVARVKFTPDKTGTFIFLCDIFCGNGHEEMKGNIVVVD